MALLRAVRRIKEGTSAILLHSGLDEKWSADSMECCCYLRNNQDLLSDGKTLCERRFGVPFAGLVDPLGAMVGYHSNYVKDLSRLHQFGPKVLPWNSLETRCTQAETGKETSWSQTLRNWTDGRIWRNLSEKLNAKEVLTPMSGERFFFPIADGMVQLFGGDQVLRTSASIRDPHRPRRRMRKSSSEIVRIFTTTSILIVVWWWGEAGSDFWSISDNSCLPSSRGTHRQTVRAERGIIPYSTEIHRRDQSYKYIIGCNAGEKSTIIGMLMKI